ncbi:hypothetical protein [Adhaeribacter pallidiroseus]|uniref:Uncharacterized protein n=1 Tax=Adhaeribacter pallidiroseus TaxID=2072847 RepID=A0A369QBG7_9BACT|nr:hypothetical protein [Adhaeribacter pallidiroseus]RDC62261.1 hypothetical protein AHMF7616_00852 [Adhaeribacter pallidiroseus]
MNATSTISAPANSFISNISSKATITIDAAESLVQVSWTSTPSLSDLAESADYLVSIIKQYRITQLLHDVRMVDYVNIDVQRCLTHVFCPQIMTAGVTRIVHLANYVMPDLLLIDQITECVKHRYVTNRHTKLEICTTPEGAAEWFKNNSIAKPTVTQKQAEVKLAAQVATINEFSSAITLLRTYKEKAYLLGKILFKPKALFSN